MRTDAEEHFLKAAKLFKELSKRKIKSNRRKEKMEKILRLVGCDEKTIAEEEFEDRLMRKFELDGEEDIGEREDEDRERRDGIQGTC